MVVLIVDDELPIREWMKLTFEKANAANLTILTASNGQEALDIVISTTVNIIFADIRMPILDGLDLLKKVKELNKNIYVAILTSYSDFSYARTAFRLHADEYVLKTEISEATIRDVIDKYMSRISEKKESKQSLESHFNRTALLKNLISKPLLSAADLKEMINAAQVDIADQPLVSIAMSFRYTSTLDPSNMLILNDENLCNNTFFLMENNTFLLLTNFSKQNALPGNAQYSCWNLIDRIEKLFDKCHIGISNIGSGYNDLQKCVQQSLQVLNSTFYSNVPTQRYSCLQNENNLSLTNFYDTITDIRHKINDQDFIRARQGIIALFDKLEHDMYLDTYILKRTLYTLLEEYFSIKNEDNDEQFDYVMSSIESITNAYTFLELQKSFLAVFDTLAAQFQNQCTNEYVKAAKQYVREHYCSISSNSEVACMLHLNPEYFCRLFKKETGMNFNTYITQYRLSMAEKLIKTTTLSINEIANSVGYENVNYFSHTYRKIMGITPTDVRTSKKGEHRIEQNSIEQGTV